MLSFHRKAFLIQTIAFVAFTIIGALTHEYGHIAVAKYLGYETTLHYGSMNYDIEQKYPELVKIYSNHKSEVESGAPFERKEEYISGMERLQAERFWIRIGGPAQTLLTGLLGLTILCLRRRRIHTYGLEGVDWLAVFLSLFWLREVFNLFMSVSMELISPDGSYFGGDERYISYYLNLGEGTVSIILGLLGLFVSIFVIFKIIPLPLRFTFIGSGLLGGILGYILWIKILGPLVLP